MQSHQKIKQKYKFKFIDLFAGIGGFHQAMSALGGECVMASEINQACVDTYKLNFKDVPVMGDLTKISPKDIPYFDVLCAGFPCQPFSKAGAQQGFSDKDRGNLFYTIMNILDSHPEAKFLILENVRNLADKTENWDIITNELAKRNFYITESPIILSPHNFGIPQIRERVYILGMRKDIRNTDILTNGFIHISDLHLSKYINKNNCAPEGAWKILEEDIPDDYLISSEQKLMINAWEEFRLNIGLTDMGPVWMSAFGIGIYSDIKFEDKIEYNTMPNWKKRIVDSNRRLYKKEREKIDSWAAKYSMQDRIKLFQKFEWNCAEDVDNIKNTIIQVRQSGLRVKRPSFFPSLVAMVNTPIIWDKKKKSFRRITPREAANLQSFRKNFKFTGQEKQIYKQLGNSVNVKILITLSKKLFRLANKGWNREY